MLNPSQQSAVDYDGGHLLIVAGPGTGKTHTLTHRIARIAAGLSEGQGVLAVTFTNKAAGELEERLAALAGRDGSRSAPLSPLPVTIGTFHSVCLALLREHHAAAGLPADLAVIDPDDIPDLVKAIWPREPSRERKRKLASVGQWKSQAPRQEAPPPEVADYDRALRATGQIDFDDVLLLAARLLEADAEVLTAFRRRFGQICVDEYQDINPVQHHLLKLWAGSSGTVTAIGDPCQAIYAFRGSDVAFFRRFPEDFPGAQVMALSDNYRSAPRILSACGQVMAAVAPEASSLQARVMLDGRLVIHAAPTDKAEAESVVHRIEKLVGGTSMFSQDSGRTDYDDEGERSFGDIAVLYRLHGLARELERAFERSGIPYTVTGRRNGAEDEDPLEDAVGHRPPDEADLQVEKVALMSLHAAKGLEFPVVFIIGCEDGLVPLRLDGLASDEDEERRLFYVGMSRAKERLYLLRASRRRLYGRLMENPASPFLSDIEEELKEYERRTQKARRVRDKQMSLFGSGK